ncbi:MAG: cation:proton antiporter [Zoogloea sp.]|uniref:cation:proton antiporter n=1 Tax=Zoogloea sp. TaxID=49181 RepID=UPI0026386B49|nr:cation:proton antiporter [Zoogloea sp.]MDD2990635.1 cation:proton antiporter [Zoogloea sp.]
MPSLFEDIVLSPLLLFGLCLLGGLASGELSRRLFNLPRTTGYVLCGLVLGQSGLGWIDPYVLGSAQFFIYPALGLILFELGQRLPLSSGRIDPQLLALGLIESMAVFVLVLIVMLGLGFGVAGGLFAAAIAVSTSPAITIATSSDVGGEGALTSRLFGLVAMNGCFAFAAIELILPSLAETGVTEAVPGYGHALGSIGLSVLLGGLLAFAARQGARWLGPQVEHQHLMLLGLIVLGTGLPLSIEMSPLMSLLAFGVGVRVLDREREVVAIRIASDARVFLVVTFVLAGAALELAFLQLYWQAVLVFVVTRFLARGLALQVVGPAYGLSRREAAWTAVGLLPMSSVALVLLGDAGSLDQGIGPSLGGTLMGAIALMQLLGPLCTQAAIRGFGEARRYVPRLRQSRSLIRS